MCVHVYLCQPNQTHTHTPTHTSSVCLSEHMHLDQTHTCQCLTHCSSSTVTTAAATVSVFYSRTRPEQNRTEVEQYQTRTRLGPIRAEPEQNQSRTRPQQSRTWVWTRPSTKGTVGWIRTYLQPRVTVLQNPEQGSVVNRCSFHRVTTQWLDSYFNQPTSREKMTFSFLTRWMRDQNKEGHCACCCLLFPVTSLLTPPTKWLL